MSFGKFIIIFLFLSTTATAIFFLIYRSSPRKASETETPTPSPSFASSQVANNIHISMLTPPADSKLIFEFVILNGLKIENISKTKISVEDKELEKVDLLVKFVYNGRERKLVIPIIYSIAHSIISKGSIGEGDILEVGDLPLNLGDEVNIELRYISIGKNPTFDQIRAECIKRLYYLPCDNYLNLDLGFGNQPINFAQYFDQLLSSSDIPTLDLTKSFPSNIHTFQ